MIVEMMWIGIVWLICVALIGVAVEYAQRHPNSLRWLVQRDEDRR